MHFGIRETIIRQFIFNLVILLIPLPQKAISNLSKSIIKAYQYIRKSPVSDS